MEHSNSYTLSLLKQLAAGLAAQFGEDCEVAVHDLESALSGHSIVHIENGHVTGRKIGDGPSNAVLTVLRHNKSRDGSFKDQLAYLTQADNGHILKSSTICVNDENQAPRYIFSINYDITNFLAFQSSLSSFVGQEHNSREQLNASPMKIALNVNDLLDVLLAESVKHVGTPAPLMTKEEKIKAVNYLNDAGAFLITKAGDKVAGYFGISKYTLYNYVDINKNHEEE